MARKSTRVISGDVVFSKKTGFPVVKQRFFFITKGKLRKGKFLTPLGTNFSTKPIKRKKR